MWAGDQKVPIQGYGDVDIEVQGPKGQTRILHLRDVAYCESFACNLVSLRQLQKQGYWWDNRPDHNLLRRSDNSIVAELQDHHDQYVLEYLPEDLPKGAFFARRNRFNSWTRRKPVLSEAMMWHLRLGHPGPQALEHLVNCSHGARIRGPTTVECDACGVSKAKRQIRRFPREVHEGPGLHLAIDFHDFQRGFGRFTSMMLVTDRWSGFIWDYYFQNRTAKSIIKALTNLLNLLERQYGIKPKQVDCDNEIFDRKPEVRRFLEDPPRSIRIEPSAPYTGAQNGAAERSGGVIEERSRAMRKSANLPDALWPEITRAAVYLHNRTPRYNFNWKSPYERFHTYLALQDGIVVRDRKPDQAHLKAYGCKAFALTIEAQKKEKRLQRLNPKAFIGYLVGYDSTNIYRIWNPKLNRVVRTRDVIFNENEGFDGNIKHLEDQLLHVDLEDLTFLLNRLDQPASEDLPEAERTTADDEGPISGFDGSLEEETEASDLTGEVEKEPDLDLIPYPTPERSPPAALLAASINQPDGIQDPFGPRLQAWKAAFNAGRLAQGVGSMGGKLIDRAKVQRLTQKPGGLRTLYRKDLPQPPSTHRDLEVHPFGAAFEEAEKDHLQSHAQMRSWTEVSRSSLKDHKILDCRWVYVYKFDKHGRLLKCKARLVVRGDQQAQGLTESTYAATLAGRSFRALMAIAARFDLEVIQFDAVNAFVNAQLDEEVFMRLPPGYRKPGEVLRLNKALYGLRRSPLLWQKELTSALTAIGFQPVPHEPCCLTQDGILIFFYVDDIVLAYRKAQEPEARDLINQLKKRYNLTGGGELQWFLGIEIHRDRENRRIWLSQSSYIDKITNLAGSDHIQTFHTPMAKEELLPYEGRASHHEVNLYQRKIGSLLYAAVITRPDVAFAVSRLARFLTNPSPKHHEAADRVFYYLRRYRGLAIQLGGGDDFLVASDASFADNTVDRKSSQAYAMKLFGGLIGWRASKQNTVTTSTTEAELLALSQAAKEGLYVGRLLRELTIRLEDHHIQVQCDNRQTIRLVNEDVARLQTKLRHVDIHNHWLRQEAANRKIKVEYTPSDQMIADGLTKALTKEAHQRFVNQLGMVDISERLSRRKEAELHLENLEFEGLYGRE